MIFCDNTCRAKYASIKANSFYFQDKDIQPYLFEFKNEINQISAFVATKSNIPDILEDLKKEAPYCIWKCLQNSKTEKVKHPYFCKYYKKHLFSYLKEFEYSEFYYSLDFFENNDKIIELAYFENYDTTIDSMSEINKMTKKTDNLPVSCRIAIDRYIFDFDIEKLMKKYNATRRQVVYNCSKGKELLRLKIDEF